MTEIGDRVEVMSHGSCMVLDIMEMTTLSGKPKRALFGKPKYHVFVFVDVSFLRIVY
jgi:hypothetical protein